MLVDENDARIRDPIAIFAGVQPDAVSWVSPLASDDWAEYRDKTFLDMLDISPATVPLADFWPSRGPQWDALGLAGQSPILIEAKAHLEEMLSPPCGASLKSRAKITRSLLLVQTRLRIAAYIDWLGVGYQYTNRLAHLFFLRELNSIPAHLVFVYFCNDPTLTTSATEQQWEGAVQLFESMMGTRRHQLSRYVHHLFIDVNA